MTKLTRAKLPLGLGLLGNLPRLLLGNLLRRAVHVRLLVRALGEVVSGRVPVLVAEGRGGREAVEVEDSGERTRQDDPLDRWLLQVGKTGGNATVSEASTRNVEAGENRKRTFWAARRIWRVPSRAGMSISFSASVKL